MEEFKNIKIALLGSGTVGTGVYKLIERQKDELPHKIGANLSVSKVLVRDKNKKREGINPEHLTDQWEDIITDDDIQIVVEVMGGIEPARTYITQALQAGKNVVTANKDLMAVHGGELLDIATENGCDLLFEASVAGGIPIIRPLKQCLAGNYISEVMGIVNGTTNFILTKMTHEGMEFDEALALATELGYAEADPTADIEGYDAGRKMAIMASIAFNSRVTFNDVYTEGITNITAKDIKYAEAMGCTIKLLGVAKNTDTGIEVRVHPMLIPSDHPLATVNDSFNAVFVKNFRAGAAWTGVAHLPEIVFSSNADNAVVGQAGNLFPYIIGFIVVMKDGYGQAVFGQAEFFGDQFPGPGNGIVFEIVAEREVAEHFKKRVVADGIADVVKVVVFAAGTDGFLRCGCAGIVAFFIAGKDMFELHHAGVGKHQGRVIIRNQRRGRDNFMVVFCEVIQKSASNVFQCCSHSNFISQMQFDLNLIFFRLFWDKSPANF